jgi:hypothetical protein
LNIDRMSAENIRRVIGDALQDMAQIEFRVEIINFGTERAVNGRWAFAAGMRPRATTRSARSAAELSISMERSSR